MKTSSLFKVSPDKITRACLNCNEWILRQKTKDKEDVIEKCLAKEGTFYQNPIAYLFGDRKPFHSRDEIIDFFKKIKDGEWCLLDFPHCYWNLYLKFQGFNHKDDEEKSAYLKHAVKVSDEDGIFLCKDDAVWVNYFQEIPKID